MKELSRNDKKANYLRDRVQENPTIRNIGYTFFSERVERDDILGQKFEYIFLNEGAKRKLKINFFPNFNSKLIVSAYLINENNNRINILDYMQKDLCCNETQSEPFNFIPTENNFQQKIDNAVAFIEAALKGKLHDVATGKKWENIPFDWHGYK